MRYLRGTWRLWSDILTFDWLDRLSVHAPRLGYNLKRILWSVWFGMAAWYFLDPRFRIYENHRYIEMNWTWRILNGSVLLGAALAPLILFLFFKVRGGYIKFQWPPFGRLSRKRE